MEAFLIQLWNMSLQAGFVICIILAARLFFALVKAPKKYAYALWAIPFFRMICPWAVESVFSLLPKRTEPINSYQMSRAVSYVQGFEAVSVGIQNTGSGVQETGVAVFNGMKLMGMIYFTGILLLFLYSVISYCRLKKRLACSVCMKDHIYFADYIDTPFVLGFLRPLIYLPSTMKEHELEYVIAHEQTHIRRKDHFIKMLAFFITCVHWFNPLAWIAFICMGKDMEMSCDEAVMKQFGESSRKEYANILLELTGGRRNIAGTPLAFGEGNTKSRIVNIMKYKKPLLVVVILAIVSLTALTAGLLTNPKEERAQMPDQEEIAITRPRISVEDTTGADGPQLDYAKDGTIIFHGYFGLFVYSMQENDFIGAIDLEAIGCHYTQGDNYCEVNVAADGSKVYMHPMLEEVMYVYDVESNQLVKQEYSMDGIDIFENIRNTRDCVAPDYTIFRSYNCVEFSSDSTPYYGYLESGSGMLRDLIYIEGDMAVSLFDGLKTENDSDVVEDLGICIMDIVEGTVTPTGATIRLYNTSDGEIIYGEGYELARKENEAWVDVPTVITDWGFKDVAYGITSEEKVKTIEVDWEWLYGELPPGTYLFLKKVMIPLPGGETEQIELGIEFVL